MMTGPSLLVASVLFWCAWLLMPGVGVTDTDVIFALVGAHREQVFASVVLQLLSAAAYAPAALGLFASEEGRASKGLRAGCALLVVGAMGSAADAIFHLVAYEMTAPGIDVASMAVVMRRLQGPDLALLLPMVLALFAGHVAIAASLRERDAATRTAFRLLAWLPVLVVAGAAARRADLVPGRVVGLAALGALSGSLALVGVSFLSAKRRAQEAQ
jgi:hypothetical protein